MSKRGLTPEFELLCRFGRNALLHDPFVRQEKNTAHFKKVVEEQNISARIPVSGANAADCEKAIETMRTTFALMRSVVRETINNLNENLPVTATVNYDDQMNLLYDMEGELVGKLANAAEAVS